MVVTVIRRITSSTAAVYELSVFACLRRSRVVAATAPYSAEPPPSRTALRGMSRPVLRLKMVMLSSRRNRRFDSAIDRMCGSSIYYLDSTMYDAQHNLVP